MSTTTHPPVPAAVLRTHAIHKARLQVARTTSDLEHATIEHAAALERLATLEATK